MVPEGITAAVEGNEIVLTAADDLRPTRAKHGLARSIMAGMVKGVHDGYSKTLEIVGTGYRASRQGPGHRVLPRLLPHHHRQPARRHHPEGDRTPNHVVVEGTDKQVVGQVAANIRKLRAPEPYKGKGIKYSDERILRKAGKAGK